MINFFSKKLNKKGFTLAELLIVVAIIAILVAIAVPIFTAQLNKARIAVHQANARSVKSAAVAAIMEGNTIGTDKADITQGEWTVTGTVDSATGAVALTSIGAASTGEDTVNGTEVSSSGSIAPNGTLTYVVHLKASDIGTAPTAGAGG